MSYAKADSLAVNADGITGHGWFRGQKLANGAQRAASAFIDYGPCLMAVYALGGWGCVPVLGWLGWNSVYMQAKTTQSFGKMLLRIRLVIPSSDPISCATYWAVPLWKTLAVRTAAVFLFGICPLATSAWPSVFLLWPALWIFLCVDDRRESALDKCFNTMVLARAENLKLSTTQGARDR